MFSQRIVPTDLKECQKYKMDGTLFDQPDSLTISSHPIAIRNHFYNLVNEFKPCTIMDIGGGPALHYIWVKDLDIKKYMIIEIPSVIERAMEKPRPLVEYKERVEDYNEHIDILYSNAGLPYLLDPIKTLNYTSEILRPKYMLFHRIHITPRETYCAKQENQDCPYWFFNIEDFRKIPNYQFQETEDPGKTSYNEIYGGYSESCHYLNCVLTRIE